eukprot:scaffold55010_cov30-Tisochrysis_lutea.AAC.1
MHACTLSQQCFASSPPQQENEREILNCANGSANTHISVRDAWRLAVIKMRTHTVRMAQPTLTSLCVMLCDWQ